MIQQKIKKLATITASNKIIPADIEEYVLNFLTKQDLKMFMQSYKLELEKKRVYISTPTELSESELSLIKNMYKDKDIITSVEKDLGAGIKLRQNDTVIDFTVKSFINDTVDALKN